MKTYSEKAARALSDARNRTGGDYTWHSSCGKFLVECEAGTPIAVRDRITGRDVTYLARRAA